VNTQAPGPSRVPANRSVSRRQRRHGRRQLGLTGDRHTPVPTHVR